MHYQGKMMPFWSKQLERKTEILTGRLMGPRSKATPRGRVGRCRNGPSSHRKIFGSVEILNKDLVLTGRQKGVAWLSDLAWPSNG
jgi:hypothetical protein